MWKPLAMGRWAPAKHRMLRGAGGSKEAPGGWGGIGHLGAAGGCLSLALSLQQVGGPPCPPPLTTPQGQAPAEHPNQVPLCRQRLLPGPGVCLPGSGACWAAWALPDKAVVRLPARVSPTQALPGRMLCAVVASPFPPLTPTRGQ